MDDVEKVVKKLYGRKTDHDYRYDFFSLSPDVRDAISLGSELTVKSFKEQVQDIIYKEDVENEEDK